MSIFSKIVKDVESFASKIELALKKLFGDAPEWITIAQGVLTYLGPIVVTILTIGGGSALGTEANDIIGVIRTDLATAYAATQTVNGAATVQGLLTGIQAQLPNLLAALKISNPASLNEIENYVGIIGTELTALLDAI